MRVEDSDSSFMVNGFGKSVSNSRTDNFETDDFETDFETDDFETVDSKTDNFETVDSKTDNFETVDSKTDDFETVKLRKFTPTVSNDSRRIRYRSGTQKPAPQKGTNPSPPRGKGKLFGKKPPTPLEGESMELLERGKAKSATFNSAPQSPSVYFQNPSSSGELFAAQRTKRTKKARRPHEPRQAKNVLPSTPPPDPSLPRPFTTKLASEAVPHNRRVMLKGNWVPEYKKAERTEFSDLVELKCFHLVTRASMPPDQSF
jgi:hypothetical protein